MRYRDNDCTLFDWEKLEKVWNLPNLSFLWRLKPGFSMTFSLAIAVRLSSMAVIFRSTAVMCLVCVMLVVTPQVGWVKLSLGDERNNFRMDGSVGILIITIVPSFTLFLTVSVWLSCKQCSTQVIISCMNINFSWHPTTVFVSLEPSSVGSKKTGGKLGKLC